MIRGGNGEDKLARWFLENSSDKHTQVESVEDNSNWSCDDQINDDDVLPNTPIQSSDDEEDCVDNLFKRKSNFKQWELHLGQIFNDVQAFKDALVIYVLNEQRNIKLCRWEKEKHEAICCGEGCRWRIYCALDRPLNKWQVKVYIDIHTCINIGHCKMIKIPIIARLWLERLRKNPDISACEIEEEMLSEHNIHVSENQCQKAKTKALEAIRGDLHEQFSRLWDYEFELCRSNKGTTAEIQTIQSGGEHQFNRFYVCFDALRKSWLKTCRSIIGLDGCFLKWAIKGEILSAVGRDGNNGIYPIAWAVVQVENNENWLWFVKKLKCDLGLKSGSGITIISDKQKVC